MGLKEERELAGQTLLQEEERAGLLVPLVRTREDLNRAEHWNIQEAMEWTLGKRRDAGAILTEQFVKELHRRMFGKVWQWAGKFRRSNTNLGADWKQVSRLLVQLHGDVLHWEKERVYPPEECVIRYKHRLVSIHCFPNGNGRHSRLMADLLIGSVSGAAYFSWGAHTRASLPELRGMYLSALRDADRGDYRALMKFARS